MNAEELLKTFDPEQKIQAEMFDQLNEMVKDKPAMFSAVVLLNYIAAWIDQLTKDDSESRLYMAELIKNFSNHINANLK